MGYTESYACGVQIRPHSEAQETEAGITEESCVQKKHTALVSVVSITTSILSLTMLIICVVVPAHAGKLGLVSAWLFEERDGDVVKDVVSGNDGEIKGKLSWFSYGKFGRSLKFSGNKDSYVHIPHDDVFNADPYTFVAWVKLKPAAWHYIVWRNGDVWPEPKEVRHLDIWVHEDGFPVFMWNAGKEKGQIDGKAIVTDDQWHHIAKVYDGKSIKMFVDGKLDNEKPSGGTLDTNESPIWIGAYPGGIAAIGLLDEVGFFTTALSENELNDVMGTGLADYAAVEASGKATTTWATMKAGNEK